MSNPAGTKRALLVTSSYAPTTIADMHRVRHLAWELPALGWEVEVLCPNAAFQRAEYLEPGSEPLFNPATSVHEVAPRDRWFFRPLKIRSIGWRAFRPLCVAGDELLRRRRFDLVFISTANFKLFCLGRRWARKFNVPYVLDYHDPWVRERINYRTTAHPWKMRVGALLARWMERSAIHGAAGVVAVSPAYLDDLRWRYGNLPGLRAGRCEAIPFAASERDFAPSHVAPGAGELSASTSREITYVGAGGCIMAKSFTEICAALAEVRRHEPDLLTSLRVRLLGTYAYWKPGEPKPLQEIAMRFGLGDVVEEIPPRISYRMAMELAGRSDGLLVLGVDDAGYVPSKLFTYALSGKPLVASFRADSPAKKWFDEMPGLGTLMTFGRADGVSPDGAKAMRGFLTEVRQRRRFDRRVLIARYLAPTMASRHAALFDRICSGGLAC